MISLLDSLRDTQTTIANYVTQERTAQKSEFLSTSEVSTSLSFFSYSLAENELDIQSIFLNMGPHMVRHKWKE